MWPRAGAWAASESAGVVNPCAPPDPQSRCTGWNLTTGATQCGPQYRQGSYLCGSCAGGFYGDASGGCSPCPQYASTWERYSGVLIVIAVLAGLVAAVWGVLVLLVFFRGGTIAGGASRVVSLGVWVLLTLQVLSQAASVTSASLPGAVQALYSAVGVLQLDLLQPPACTGAYPFEEQASVANTGGMRCSPSDVRLWTSKSNCV